jgi:DNA-binding transcriptional ArsR family regulator
VVELTARRVIDDVATLKALADPVRLRILDLAMSEPDRTFTAKEFARTVGVTPTKIYYHLNLLEQHDLVQIRDTRVVNGIIEKHYGAGQLDLTFHRRSGEEETDSVQQIVSTLLGQVREEITAGLAAGLISPSSEAPDPQRMLVSRTIAEIPEGNLAEFREELLALTRRFQKAGTPNGHRFSVLVAMHPTNWQ